MNFASKLSFLWLVHPLCSLGYRFVPSTGRHSSLPPSPSGREENLWDVGGLVSPQKNFTQPHETAGQTRHAKPHHLMKCARMGAFRGAWGEKSPHKKPPPPPRNTGPNTTHQASPPHEMRPDGRISGGVGDQSPHKKTAWEEKSPHKKEKGA